MNARRKTSRRLVVAVAGITSVWVASGVKGEPQAAPPTVPQQRPFIDPLEAQSYADLKRENLALQDKLADAEMRLEALKRENDLLRRLSVRASGPIPIVPGPGGTNLMPVVPSPTPQGLPPGARAVPFNSGVYYIVPLSGGADAVPVR